MTDTQTETSNAWRPEAGEKIKGTITDISTGDGGWGPYPILTLETEDGERTIHAFHTVLRTELARRRPRIGDEIEATYLGKQPGGEREYHGYRVKGGQVQGYDWSRDVPDEDIGRPQSESPQSDIPADMPGDQPGNDDDAIPF